MFECDTGKYMFTSENENSHLHYSDGNSFRTSPINLFTFFNLMLMWSQREREGGREGGREGERCGVNIMLCGIRSFFHENNVGCKN